ncbi:MAG: zf-HC2 domain-containing protein [Nannocystaceae bacterium]|nr:zf-HC2 domain-containing protein [Nannocystaceae bacterium]
MSERPYITCRELIDFIADWREGTLAPTERFEFERHLAVCPSCVAYLDSYETTVAALALLREREAPPAEVPPALLDAIRKARRG